MFPYVILLAFDCTDLSSGNNSQLKEIIKKSFSDCVQITELDITATMKKVPLSSFHIVTGH